MSEQTEKVKEPTVSISCPHCQKVIAMLTYGAGLVFLNGTTYTFDIDSEKSINDRRKREEKNEDE